MKLGVQMIFQSYRYGEAVTDGQAAPRPDQADVTGGDLHVHARGHRGAPAGSEGDVFGRAQVGAGRFFGRVGGQLARSVHAYLEGHGAGL